MAEKFLFIAPETMKVTITPARKVGVMFDYRSGILGLAPGLELAVELTPTQARELAAILLDKARESEGGQLQH